MIQLNDDGEDDMEELSFSSLAKKDFDLKQSLVEGEKKPEPVVEAPKAAATKSLPNTADYF